MGTPEDMSSISAVTLSASAVGFGGAIAFGVFGYVLAIAALRFLPETHGKELVPTD